MTPGPWKCENKTENTSGEVYDASGYFVAKVHRRNGDNATDPTCLANTRAIAAAPVMLEALALTLGNLKSLKANAFKSFDTIDGWIEQVELAIRLAERGE